jgi:two-component system response regulator
MNAESLGRPIEVLLVEDDPADVELTLEVMDRTRLKVQMNVVKDGVEAMEYLRRDGKYTDSIRPDLILLDLNMPRKDGREVLHEIKSDEDLKSISVVILTTSDSDEDIIKTYATGANCYVTKPVGLEQFIKVVKAIEDFWFTVVKYPIRREDESRKVKNHAHCHSSR